MKSMMALECCPFPTLPAASGRWRVWLPVLAWMLVGTTWATAADGVRGRSSRSERGTYKSPTAPPSTGTMIRPQSRVTPVAAAEDPQPTIMAPPPGEVIPVPRGEEIYLDETAPYDPAVPFSDHGEVYQAGCDALPMTRSLDGCGLEGEFLGEYLAEPGCGISDCGGCDACSGSRCIPLPRLCSDRWFGSAELLLWRRRGQSFPVLAATPETTTPGQALFGGQRVGESTESGLRLTAGYWLDDSRCEAATVRVWGLDRERADFGATGADGITVVRPFRDVSDGLPGTAEENVVVRPDTRDLLDIGFRSDVYGGDAAIRQLWARGLGGRIDLLYGYQYLRLDENLTIDSRTAGPLDSTQSITDVFDVENEFHGGQIGVAVRYDERCWSFDGLAKLGLGSLQRRADLSGTTVNRVGDAETTLDEGLLVRSTNAGATSDGTFAVIPELSLGLGYQFNRNLDVTVGYDFLLITDALQTWQTLDDSLAVNLEDPPLSPARPSRSFSYNDYWVHGVHFGVNYNF